MRARVKRGNLYPLRESSLKGDNIASSYKTQPKGKPFYSDYSLRYNPNQGGG